MKIDRTDYEHTSGNTGEKIVYDWLISRGNEVEDVTLNQSYQKTDVDFVVNNSYKIEVKVDQKIEQTGNVYVELGYSQEDWNHKGWIDYCGADYLLKLSYTNTIANMYFFDFKKLLKLVNANNNIRSRYDSKEMKTQLYSLLRLDDLKKNGIFVKKVTINRKAGVSNGNEAN